MRQRIASVPLAWDNTVACGSLTRIKRIHSRCRRPRLRHLRAPDHSALVASAVPYRARQEAGMECTAILPDPAGKVALIRDHRTQRDSDPASPDRRRGITTPLTACAADRR